MDLSSTKEIKKGNCKNCGKYKYYTREYRSKKKTEKQRPNQEF